MSENKKSPEAETISEQVQSPEVGTDAVKKTVKGKSDSFGLWSVFASLFRFGSAENPIVPERSVSSQTLMIVVAIMSFLACLTFAAVTMVWQQAVIWQNEISQEVTIQIRPIEGYDLQGEVDKATRLAAQTPGVSSVVPLSEDWSKQLLEPWLGQDFDLQELPIPVILVLELDSSRPANLVGLADRINNQVQGASFDDHRLWLERLGNMANTTVFVGTILMLLMLTAMVLSVTFATHGAMISNNEVVEVLHFIGGRDAFIANEFQQRFLVLGLKGGFVGGIAAIGCFLILNVWSNLSGSTLQDDQLNALFGRFAIGWAGYIGTALLVIVVAILTAVTSRIAVFRYLTKIN